MRSTRSRLGLQNTIIKQHKAAVAAAAAVAADSGSGSGSAAAAVAAAVAGRMFTLLTPSSMDGHHLPKT